LQIVVYEEVYREEQIIGWFITREEEELIRVYAGFGWD
jgi:hypothetical protein